MGHELPVIPCCLQPMHNFFGDLKLQLDVTNMVIALALEEVCRIA
jgi:hypothetical protein